MTIAASTRYKKYSPTVPTSTFLVTFPIFGVSDLRVVVGGADTTLYSVTGTFSSGRSNNASVVLITPASGVDVEIYGRREPARLTNYLQTSPNLAKSLQYDADVLTAVQQEQKRDFERTLKVSAGLGVQPEITGLVDGASLIYDAASNTFIPGPNASEIASASQAAADVIAAGSVFKTAASFGAVGDGVTNNATALQALSNSAQMQVIPNGNYPVTGTLTTQARPKIVFADNATVAGQMRPMLALSKYAPDALPRAMFFVEQDTAHRTDTQTAFIQRVVTTNDSITNPKALKVATVVTAGGGSQIEWAVSGEVTNSDNTRVGAEGGTAVSGVARKLAANTGIMFGGHFQVKDETGAATVGGIVGVEVNIQANGADTNGNRIGFDLIAKTFGAGAAADFTAGLRVRNGGTVEGGRWLSGVLVQDGNQAILNGVNVQNSPGSAVGYGYADTGTKAYGLRLDGTYGGAAIRIATGQALSIESTDNIRTSYGTVANVWGFYNLTNERIGFDMTATPAVRIAGNKIIGTRGAALPAAATDLASAITLVNDLRAKLTASSGTVVHPLFA